MCQMFAGQDPDRYEYVTRRLRLNGRSTSIRLERALRGILDQMAEREGSSIPAFLSRLHPEVPVLAGLRATPDARPVPSSPASRAGFAAFSGARAVCHRIP